MTEDFYDHDGPGDEPTDASGDEKMMRGMYAAMPDLHLAIEDLVAEGDKVVCKNHGRWTDPSTGKKMSFHGFVLWRFEGDKIAERWATVTRRPRRPHNREWIMRCRPRESWRSSRPSNSASTGGARARDERPDR
jgi:SnoaL-like polyketide cyclase